MVSPSPVATQLYCTQCGGELHPDEGQVFLTCPFCGATVYLDKARVVFHWSIAPTLNEQQAAAALNRWMSGNKTVKDLDKKAQVVGQSFQYFPLWYFKWSNGAGKAEQEALKPAAATAVTELTSLRLPAGDMKPYHPDLDPLAVAPTVPLEAALDWLRQSQGAQAPQLPSATAQPGTASLKETASLVEKASLVETASLMETAVVHVPLYLFKYDYRGQTFTAVVDAAAGTVLANIFPAKEEMPYRLVGGVTALVYLCLATFPLAGIAIGDESGLTIGLSLCGGLGLLAAPALFAWAYWVAAKV